MRRRSFVRLRQRLWLEVLQEPLPPGPLLQVEVLQGPQVLRAEVLQGPQVLQGTLPPGPLLQEPLQQGLQQLLCRSGPELRLRRLIKARVDAYA